MDSSKPISKSSDNLGPAQTAWIFIQTILNAGITFGINYGIAGAIFAEEENIRMWDFPLPLAGTKHFYLTSTGVYGVTIIIQIIASWLISGVLLRLDVNGKGLIKIPPLSHEYLSPSWRTRWIRYRFWLTIIQNDSPKQSIVKVIGTAVLRTVPWIVYTFVAIWPLAAAFTYGIWGLFVPAFLSKVFAGVIGAWIVLVTMPLWCLAILLEFGYRSRKVLSLNNVTISED
jgi:hypothetical protein